MAKKKLTTSAADYEVGRSKPPRSSQFKPGQSGNPGGRRKGSRNFKSILLEVLDSEIELIENGRKRKVPLIKAIILRQAQVALSGKDRVMDSVLDRYERCLGQEVEHADELPEDDAALLEQALGSLRRNQGAKQYPVAEGPFDLTDEEDLDHD
jgi:hypothetical protein